jgi:predicted RNA binding protein YcfA (HicA-like mRNA interferase family)
MPVVSGREAAAAFQHDGWRIDRTEGSHIIMIKPGNPIVLSVPNHREIKRGTLRSLIRHAGLDVEEFTRLL